MFCLQVYLGTTCVSALRSEEVVGSLETGLIDHFRSLCGWWETNLGPR